MQNFKITKNGKDLVTYLSKEDAVKKFFPAIGDNSNGYIYDNDAETVFNEVDKMIVARVGDEHVVAGDDVFEIVEQEEE